MSTTVTIGGTPYVVPVMTFAALKAAWADIKALAGQDDPVAQGESAIRIIAAALAASQPELTAPVIEERTRVREYPALVAAVVDILRDAGLVAPGEPQTGMRSAPSTTSTS